MARVKNGFSENQHRLSQLQTFKSSAARLLNVRDMPECDILHKLQTLSNAHQEFTLLSRRYENASPIPDNPQCQRFDEPMPVAQCRPMSSTESTHNRRYIDSGFDHFEDEFEFGKKF